MPADHNGENLAESMNYTLDGWCLSEEKQIVLLLIVLLWFSIVCTTPACFSIFYPSTIVPTLVENS